MNLSPFLHNALPRDYKVSDSPLKSLYSRVKCSNSSKTTASAVQVLKNLTIQESNVKKGKVVDFDEAVMSAEDSECSLLDQPISPETEQEFQTFLKGLGNPPDADFLKIASNMIGDGLITGQKGIDGSIQPSKNFELWKILLSDLLRDVESENGNCPESIALRNIVTGVTQIHEHAKDVEDLRYSNFSTQQLHKTSLKYANHVHQLKVGESRAFYGGYLETGSKDASGHALIYEITRLENNNLNLQVYTSTGFNQINSFSIGSKNKQETLALFSNIPESELLFNEDGVVRPGFMQAILEPSVIGTVNTNLKVNMKDVERILKPYSKYRTSVDIKERGLITGQIGGTCSDSVMKVFIRHHSGNLGLYKQIIHQLKFKLLVLSYKRLNVLMGSPEIKESYIARKMVLRSARNLFRTTKKLLKGSHGFGTLLTAESARRVMATSRDIILRLKEIEKDLKKKQSRESARCDLKKANYQDQRTKRRQITTFNDVQNTNTRLEKNRAPRPLTKIEPQNLAKVLKGFRDSINRVSEEVLSYEFHQLIQNIPIPKDLASKDPFWSKLTKQELFEIHEHLHRCLTAYVGLDFFYSNKNICQQDSFSLHVLSISTIHVLAHYIAVQLENGKTGDAFLGNYTIENYADVVFKSQDALFFDRNEFNRYQEIQSYVAAVNNPGKIEKLFGNYESSSINKKRVDQVSNGTYWHALLDNDRNLKNNAEIQANKKWPDINIALWKKAYKELSDSKNDPQWQYNEKVADWNRQGVDIHIFGRELINPKHIVQLPIDTKLTMLLEQFNNSENEFLCSSGLKHISNYRNICYILSQFVNRYGNFNLYSNPQRDGICSYRVNLKGNLVKDSIAPQELLKLHRPIEGEISNQLVSQNTKEYRFVNRKSESWARTNAEGSTLNKDKDTLIKRLERTLAEWELSPSQILYELSKDLDLLKDPSLQALVIKIFFRSPILENGQVELGVGNLILNNPAFLDNAYNFINRNLSLIERKTDGIKIARFLFELSLYLCKYCADAGEYEKAEKFNQIGSIKRWIASDKINENDKTSLQYYLTAFYSTKQIIEDKDYKDILLSWCSFKLAKEVDSKLVSKTIHDFGRRFIISLGPKLSEKIEDSQFRSDLGNHILKSLKLIANDTNYLWFISDEGFPYISLGINGNWRINLLTGAIYRELQELVGTPSDCPWKSDFSFNRLFSSQNLKYTQVGNDRTKSYLFSSANGNYQIIANNSNFIYQKEFSCYGQWLNFVPNEEIPTPLYYDHAFWVSKTPFKVKNFEIKGVITTLSDKKITHVCLADGRILEADSVTGLPKDNGRVVDNLQFTSPEAAISSFDNPKHVLTYRNSITNNIDQISFRRFKSINGNTLNFIEKNGEMVWSEYPNYSLPEVMPKSSFQYFKNYLYLHSKSDNKEMLLVPGTLTSSENTVPSIGLNDAPKSVFNSRRSKELNGNQVYFEYEVVQGEIKSTSTEGRLYWAYIQLLQRNYDEAIQLLKDRKSTELLSELSFDILKAIVQEVVYEDYPDAHQTTLHALLLILEQENKVSKDGISKYKYLAEKACKSYLKTFNTRNNISKNCSITTEEELILLDFFSKNCEKITDEIITRKNFLSTGHISEPSINSTLLNSSSETIIHRKSNWYETLSPNLNSYLQNFSDVNPVHYLYYNLHFQTNYHKLFFDVYRLAKSGNKAAISEMISKISYWKEYPSPHITVSEDYLDLYLSILTNPSAYPALPEKLDSNEQAQKFMDKVKKASDSLSSVTLPSKVVVKIDQKLPGSGQYPYIHQKTEEKDLKLTDVSQEPIRVSTTLDPQTSRWNALNTLKREFSKTKKTNQLPKSEFKFAYREDLLKDKEKVYKDSLIKDLEQFQRDFEAGEAQNNETVQYSIETDQCRNLHAQAKKELNEVILPKQKKLELEILSLANRQSSSLEKRMESVASIEGESSTLLTIEDCVNALLTYDGRSFVLKNENLRDPEVIKKLTDLIVEYLDCKSYCAQLGRVLKDAGDIIAIDADSASKQEEMAPTRRYLCQTLYGHLEGAYHFDEFSHEEQIILRVFAGQSGILPFKKQVVLIKRMLTLSETDPTRFKDIVIQLIMGGGKTSVIATILLYIAARRKGRLALFIVPHALLETVASNLGFSLKKSFNKDLESLNLERDDFTLFRLQQTQKLLEKCLNKDIPLILSDKTIQGFELEMLSHARKIKASIFERARLQKESKLDLIAPVTKRIDELSLKATILAQMLVLVGKNGDALLDEVDQILESQQELNYIDGIKVNVEEEFNELLLMIYKGLVSKKLTVKTPTGDVSIRDYIKLHTNQQTLLNPADYLENVAPLIAEYLAQRFSPIANHLGTLQSSFIRYASDQIPKCLQTFVDENLPCENSEFSKYSELKDYKTIHEDIHFLKHLKSLSTGIKSQILAAKLISLSKHFLTELINLTITKSGGRNYGLSPDPSTPGKIVPYIGLYSPTNREFGYHWESGAYQYQYAVANKPLREQIILMAEKYDSGAIYYSGLYGEKYEETAEYEEFYNKYGVKLDAIQAPGAVEKVIDFLSKDYKRLLEFQFDLVALYSTYSSEMLTSNGTSLGRLLSSIMAMSGTPWNAQGYIKKLAENYTQDLGTEGKIFHALIQKSQDSIYPIDFEEDNLNKDHSIKDFLTQLHKTHPQFKKVRGIIEPGGLFKRYGTNEKIAREWMDWIEAMQDKEKNLPDNQKTVNPAIDSVIFFNKDPGQAQPNVVYVIRKGFKTPERLGTSSFDELKAKGLLPKNYVVFIDERHSFGSDFLQIPDARNVMTYDENMLLKTASQGIMRLRQFLFEQNIDIVVSMTGRKAFYNKGQKEGDLLLHAAKNQSIKTAQAMVQMFRQQIVGVVDGESRFTILKAILAGDFNLDFANIVQEQEKFFVRTMTEDPINQHSRLESQGDTKVMLTNLLENTDAAYRSTVKDENTHARMTKEVSNLKDWIKVATCLPSKTKDITNRMGLQQEVQQQIDVETETQKNIEIESEIQQELQSYQTKGRKDLILENPMDQKTFIGLVESLKGRASISSIYSMQEHIKGYKYNEGSRRHYETLFDQKIYGTYAYFHTFNDNEPLSIFDGNHRPAKQLLVTRNTQGTLSWLCLSEFEAQEALNHLKTLYKDKPELFNDVWLVQPDGTLWLNNDAQPFSLGDEDVMSGLIEINALVGNIDFLDNPIYSDSVEPWLLKNSSLKLRFLKLKSLRNDTQKNRLLNSRVISNILSNQGKDTFKKQYICKLRAKRERNRKGNYIPDEVWKTKLLTASQIHDLNSDYVAFLGIDWDKRDTDPATTRALKELAASKKIATDLDLKNAAEEFSRRQLASIKIFHGDKITPQQLRWLPVEKVRFLKRADQIKVEENGVVKYLLSKQQIEGLSEHQADLIPHINPEFYYLLDKPWMVQSVPNDRLGKINPNYGYMLSDNQLSHVLSSDRNFALSLLEHLAPQQIAKVDSSYLDLIPQDKLPYVTKVQIQSISDVAMIPKLEEIAAKSATLQKGLWTSWIALKMIKFIDKTQIPFLNTKEQISEIPEALLGYIQEDQVEHLSLERLFKLKDLKKGKWKGFADRMTQDQRNLMTSEQKFQLYGADRFLEVMEERDVSYLTTKEMVRHCKSEWVKFFDDKQVANITKEQVSHLGSTQQLLACSSDLIQYIVPEQYQYLSTEILRRFTDKQLQVLIDKPEFKQYLHLLPAWKLHFVQNEEDLDKITQDQINGFGHDHFNVLADKHPLWGRITKELVEDINSNKVKNIPDELLKNVKTSKALKEISFFKVVHLDKEQIRKRRDCGFTYFLGVMTLGIAMSIISVFGYIFIPCTLCSKKKSRSYKRWLDTNFKRVGHLFTTYLPA